MKYISIVECNYNENVIRTLGKIKMESVVMRENASRFKLAYDSPLFYKSNLNKVGIFNQNEGA